jgi:hypothetical protein
MSTESTTPPTHGSPTTDEDNFLVALWTSVFTPGATPSLLLATNATFGALQFLLFALLLATHSVHFIALSIISGALWWSINWFANEVRAGEAADREAKRRAKEKEDGKGGTEGKGSDGDEEGGPEWDEDVDRSVDLSTAKGMAEGLRERSMRHASVDTDTETETEGQGGKRGGKQGRKERAPVPTVRQVDPPVPAVKTESPQLSSSIGGLSTSEDEVLLRRPNSAASRSGEASTDSEWEKVDE